MVGPSFGGSGGVVSRGGSGGADAGKGGADAGKGGSTSTEGSEGGSSQGGYSGQGAAGGGIGPSFEASDGEACGADYDCASALCLESFGADLAGAGPAGGLCSRDCTTFLLGTSPESPCSPGSTCVAVSIDPQTPQGWCLPECGPLKQCQRFDHACVPQGETGVCMPVCESDYQCAGNVCDRATGLCVPEGTPAGSDPVGSPCEPSTAPDTCQGVCLPLATDADGGAPAGACTRPCIVGNDGCASDKAECVSATPEIPWGSIGTCQPL